MTTVKNKYQMWVFNTLHEALNFIKTYDKKNTDSFSIKTLYENEVYEIEIK